MIPSVTQQLESIRRRLAETVAPELPADASFAHEQVLLIDAILGSLIECHEYEYRYAVVEHHEYRSALTELVRKTDSDDREVLDLLNEESPHPTSAAIPLQEITDATRRMKVQTERLYLEMRKQSLEGDTTPADLMAELAERQVERESSWFRRAGFTLDGSAPIGTMLGAPR